ncbi:MAG: hypothetical protein E6R04_10425 [Spirochaetes bacterium]|nr:MAG: hypothetical protein E6R04_10425 [Spirochaetota bacterium]
MPEAPPLQPINDLGDALRDALEQDAPGAWYVQIHHRADVAHIPPPKPHSASAYVVPFGIPIYIDPSVPERQFRIGRKADLVDD